MFTNLNKASRTIRRSIGRGLEHVANRHSIFAGKLEENLYDLSGRVDGFVREAKEAAARPDDARMEKLMASGREFNELADQCQFNLVTEIGADKISLHSSEMYLTFLQELRELAARYSAVSMQERALSELVAGNCVMTPTGDEGGSGGSFRIDDDDEDEAAPAADSRMRAPQGSPAQAQAQNAAAPQEPQAAKDALASRLADGLAPRHGQAAGPSVEHFLEPQVPDEPLTPVKLPRPSFLKRDK